MLSRPVKISLVLTFVLLLALNLSSVNGLENEKDPSGKAVNAICGESINQDSTIPWWQRTAMDENRNRIHDALEGGRYDPTLRFPIYVDLDSPPDEAVVSKLKSIGGEISYICKYIDTVCMRGVTYGMVEKILELDEVVFIEKQSYLTVNLDASARCVKARPSSDYSPKTGWELGFTGKDVVVAILDTGVDDNHNDLKNKFVAGYDVSGNYGVAWLTNPDDKNGHGTHIAGTIMGTGDTDQELEEREYVGVAPDAQLVDVKVLSDLGGNLGDHLIRGMEWCIENVDRFGIDILSISVGDRAGGDDGTNADARTADAAVDAGMIVVTAGGNDGPNNDGFSSVASSDKAITVGAIDDIDTVSRDDDVIAEYSNRGPRNSDNDDDRLEELKPDVVAPGTDIVACMYSPRPIGLLTGYQEMTGTSMACPHVAGVAALMLESKPDMNATQMKNILRKTAEPKGKVYDADLSDSYSVEYGFGLVDVYEALKEAVEDYQTVSIKSITNDNIIGGLYEITGTAANEDVGAIQKVEVRIDEGDWHAAVGTYEWRYVIDTLAHPNGEHNIYARCYNGRNYSDEDRVKVIFNNVILEFTSHKDGDDVYGEEILISGNTTGIEVEYIEVSIESLSYRAEDISSNGDHSLWRFKWKTKDFPEKKYKISFTPRGKNVYAQTSTLSLDFKHPPSKDDSSPIPGPSVSGVVSFIILVTIFYRRKT